MELLRSRLGVLALTAMLGVSGMTSVGCGKKDDKKDESTTKKEKADKDDEKSEDDKGSGKKKSKKADDDDDKGDKKDDKGSKKGGKYAQGDVLKHVPKDCPMLRLYVDARALQKNEAFSANADTLEEKLTSSMKDDDLDKSAKVMKALKKAGIDPKKDVRELAMCGAAKDDFVMAIGGEFAGKDPLEALSKAIEAAGDDTPKTITADGMSLLEIKGKKKGKTSYIGEVAAGVLVIADDKESITALKDEKDRTSDWKVEKDRLAVFEFREKGKVGFDLTLTTKDDAIEGKFVGTFDDSTGDKMKKQPKAFETEFGKMATGFATKMEKGPFAAVAPDVKATKITVDGNVVTVTMNVPNDHLGKLIKTLAETSPEDLKKALK
jgi:hypothetical protein